MGTTLSAEGGRDDQLFLVDLGAVRVCNGGQIGVVEDFVAGMVLKSENSYC